MENIEETLPVLEQEVTEEVSEKEILETRTEENKQEQGKPAKKELTVQDIEKKEKRNRIIFNTINYTVLSIFALFSLLPFIYMFFFSLMKESQFMSMNSLFDAFPRSFEFRNYIHAFTSTNDPSLLAALINTFTVAVVELAVGMFFTILAAFAMAKMRFKGANVTFFFILCLSMVPSELLIVTNYMTVTGMEFDNTLLAMILPFLVNIYYLFLLRNNFKQVPDDLYNAAKIDGCSDFKFCFKVMVPLAKPLIISVVLLQVIAIWNTFVWPQLINEAPLRVMSNWLMGIGIVESEGGDILQTVRIAGSVIVTLPLLALFLVFRERIMTGVSRSGLKG